MTGVSTWAVIGIAVAAAAALAIAALLLLGRGGRIPTGRTARSAAVSRLVAGLAASWIGARARRLLAGRERRARIDAARREANARRVAQTMGNMKGAIMKLGQMVSFISDDIPEEYRAVLQSLQAEAPPMDFAAIRDVVEAELGRPLERAFARFDTEPLAAASIGQVHRARLPGGEDVAVKVQYPGVADAIRADLDNVDLLYRFVGMMYPKLDPRQVVSEMRVRLSEELDYRQEASSQAAFADLYDGHPTIRIPKVHGEYSTARVLTSEFVEGRRFDAVDSFDQAQRDHYGETLYRFVFGSTSRFRVFNGDPHPGNYLFDDEGRMVFLDFGLTKYFPEKMIKRWRRAQLAHLDEDRETFRRLLGELDFVPPGSEVPADLLYDYFGYFYEPWRHDRTFTFTREYNRRSFRFIFRPEGKFAGLEKRLNMPRDFVFVNRIQWGVISILGTLRATNNWHRVHREFLHGDPPSTEMGERIAEWRAGWLERRGLAGREFFLTPAGLESAEPNGFPLILSA
jgi:predicted unusual protein kinase regulating ubiquinone biosynthesis (AarF/ABC1/UbiB family)